MNVRRLMAAMEGLAVSRALLPAPAPPTVEEALGSGALLLEQAGVETARLDAECLLGHVLGVPRWHLTMEPDRRLHGEEFAAYLRMLQRREEREPLAYLLGGREFWSLPLLVSRDVLVPRPETETLVEAALAVARGGGPLLLGPRAPGPEPRAAGAPPAASSLLLVDLCTGSGAIAIALARELPTSTVLATDISWRALRVARANAAAQGVASRVSFLRGGGWRPAAEALKGKQADLVTVNPPYVRSGLIPGLMPEVRWEPRQALDGGPDGLVIIREVVAGAPRHLRAGGVLLLEIGADQGEQVRELVEASDAFDAWRVLPDLAGRDRVVVARRSDTERERQPEP
ncbi:MAG: peptide chain release factor N(5)-glutamine methyltransferase [Candidatus Methylomirabilota bacterium]